MESSNPVDLFNSFKIDFGIFGYAVLAYAVIMLLLAILLVVALFRQKAALRSIEGNLAQISNALMRQTMNPAAAQSPNICSNCGTVSAQGTAFCQKCGSPLIT